MGERADTVSPPRVPERDGGTVIAVALVACIVLVDYALGAGVQILSLLAVPACFAAIYVGPRRTGLVALIQLGAVIGWGLAEQSDIDVAQAVRIGGVALGGIAAIAMSAVRTRLDLRLRAVSQIADLTQAAVLRPIPSIVGPIEVEVRYVSATAEARVGGDFYEVLPCAGGVRVVVGDVRGKGIGAVRLASVLVGAFRAADHDVWPLERVLTSMDAAFHRVDPGDEDFATLVLGELTSEHHLLVLNCGHPPPLVIRNDGFEELQATRSSPPIGLGPVAHPVHRELLKEERLLIYTDGLIEARTAGRTFDLPAVASQMGTGALGHAIDRLRSELVRFLGGHLDDDTTLLLAQLTDC